MSKGRHSRMILTPEQFFRLERKEFTELILQDCHDKRTTRHNIDQLLALACEQSVRAGKPLVRMRGMNWSLWLPSDDPEPEKKPTASDALRLRGMHQVGLAQSPPDARMPQSIMALGHFLY